MIKRRFDIDEIVVAIDNWGDLEEDELYKIQGFQLEKNGDLIYAVKKYDPISDETGGILIFTIDKFYPEFKSDVFVEKSIEIAELVSIKNEAYGDAINSTSEFLKLLFPYGIPTERYQDVGLILRMYDKMKRIGNGHLNDSYDDIMGYALLGATRKKSD